MSSLHHANLGVCNTYNVFKEIIHGEMKVASSFTHPCVVPNLYDFSSSVEHKEDILKNVNQRTLVPIDFHCMEKKEAFLKISSFVLHKKNKVI